MLGKHFATPIFDTSQEFSKLMSTRFCDAITAGILSETLDSELKEKRVFCLSHGTETAAEGLIVVELDGLY